jgi:metal-dependent amidase/aminoacylase/carboxypeptidase family protein
METFVRGRTNVAIASASRKVDRALRAGAMAVGGSVTITTLPGYLPIQTSPALTDLYVDNARRLVGEDGVTQMPHRSGSTDMGDLSQIMPVIHPYVGAATGYAHGADYVVTDYDLGVLTAAKAMAMTVVDLLAGGGRRGREVLSRHQAPMTKKGYLSFMRGLFSEETFQE